MLVFGLWNATKQACTYGYLAISMVSTADTQMNIYRIVAKQEEGRCNMIPPSHPRIYRWFAKNLLLFPASKPIVQ